MDSTTSQPPSTCQDQKNTLPKNQATVVDIHKTPFCSSHQYSAVQSSARVQGRVSQEQGDFAYSRTTRWKSLDYALAAREAVFTQVFCNLRSILMHLDIWK
ncbi:hypothetical protein E6O75_ATG03033 [Venturia nashicola]|uniref:Uncharacterized protein n=1 Tax=Venturia nashicola TaxID=86259 RepID=A0A4Z1P3M9_9PEZI|nr:hypothetical protein E6O75_ATG03033 [Venturia nashicola]